jgi:cell wall-associated NlpC family hydrolase
MTISRRRFLALSAALGAVALTNGIVIPEVSAAKSKEDAVVDVAKKYEGSNDYYNYCLKLANDIYAQAGYGFKRYDSAITAATVMRKKLQSKSKKGALMFWDARGSRTSGHVAIYLGDDKVLTSWTSWGSYSTGSKVSIVKLKTILDKIPGFMGYVHIGDAITFK